MMTMEILWYLSMPQYPSICVGDWSTRCSSVFAMNSYLQRALVQHLHFLACTTHIITATASRLSTFLLHYNFSNINFILGYQPCESQPRTCCISTAKQAALKYITDDTKVIS